MKFLRRASSAISLAAVFAAAFRVRGTGGTPPQHGGWRPLPLPPEDAESSDDVIDASAIAADSASDASARTPASA